MTRKEHIKWAKERVFKEKSGLMMWSSFLSDMNKHDETRDHAALKLIMTINIHNDFAVQNFIEGFN